MCEPSKDCLLLVRGDRDEGEGSGENEVAGDKKGEQGHRGFRDVKGSLNAVGDGSLP